MPSVTTISRTIFGGASLLFLVGTVIARQNNVVEALNDNPCTKSWEPGKNYTELVCSGNDVMDFLLAKVAGALFLTIFGALVFLGTICACCSRYLCQCCGSAKMRPGHCCCGGGEWDNYPPDDVKAGYDNRGVLATKGFVVLCGILGIVAVALSFSGAGKAGKLPDTIVDGVAGFADWIIGIVGEIQAGFNTQRSAFASANTAIGNIKSNMQNFKTSAVDSASGIRAFTGYFMALAGPTAVIAVCGILGIVAAIFNVQYYLPFAIIFFTCIVAVPTGLLGSAAGILRIPLGVWCNEVDAQMNGQPGIFQNYLVPTWCSSKVEFASLKNTLQTGVNTLCSASCSAISAACDSNPVYTSGSGIYYYCATTPSCPDSNSVNYAMGNITVKNGIAGESCGGCSMTRCQTDCTDSSVRAVSDTVAGNLKDAVQAIDTINRVLSKYLDCNVIINKLLSLFDLCSTLHAGLGDVQAGAGIGVTTCLLLVIGMFLGQKRFFKPSQFNKEEAELTLISKF